MFVNNFYTLYDNKQYNKDNKDKIINNCKIFFVLQIFLNVCSQIIQEDKSKYCVNAVNAYKYSWDAKD